MTLELLKRFSKRLYPSGRAFRVSSGSVVEKLETAFIKSEARVLDDSYSIMDMILPDNDNFTEDNAERWEKLLGLIVNPLLSLDTRKSAIRRKLNHPGTILARQSWDYIQQSLQSVGFNVFIHENHLGNSIEGVLNDVLGLGEMGSGEMGEIEMGFSIEYYSELFDFSEMGEIEMGAAEMGAVSYSNLLVNFVEESGDIGFSFSSENRVLFFIGGSDLGTFADVDSLRKEEFRQLILKLKPAQSVGVMFINYI